MIYRFKIWVYQPYLTEIFIHANSDTEAGETLNSIKPNSLSWQECPMSALRKTYEVIKSDDKKS
tara:strand:- start:389 stop:580 length:192 start_codon:yes stop_codon:yes gene_type:complete